MRHAFLLLLLPLCGCNWMNRQADYLGSYMPVIGERCEHWQCITSEGQAQSERNKMMMKQQQSGGQQQVPQQPPAQPMPEGWEDMPAPSDSGYQGL